MTQFKKNFIVFSLIFGLIVFITVVVFLSTKKQDIRPKINSSTISKPTITTDNKNIAPALCESATTSGNLLSSGGSVSIYSKAKQANISSFLYIFSDKDNHKMLVNGNSTYPIPSFLITQQSSLSKSNNISISYDDFNKQAAIWGDNRPKHIQVNVYFKDDQGNSSALDKKCEVYFDVE